MRQKNINSKRVCQTQYYSDRGSYGLYFGLLIVLNKGVLLFLQSLRKKDLEELILLIQN
jgi:hypothetical protein